MSVLAQAKTIVEARMLLDASRHIQQAVSALKLSSEPTITMRAMAILGEIDTLIRKQESQL